MRNFWTTLEKPFFVLAPMDDVTDVVFRQIVMKTARPDVFITEFTSCDGLFSPGRDVLMRRFKIAKGENPVVAQIWGINPETYFKTAKLVRELGFDGVDINMGCPDRNVVRSGACSALINNPTLAKEVVLATVEGAQGIPVSVKTRLGFRGIQTEEWIGFLLSLPIAALTIHGRTAKQMSKVPANWEEIGRVVDLRNQINRDILIIGNGDVKDRKDGEEKAKQYGVDGIMIGRGIFKDIFAFAKEKPEVSHEFMLKLMLEHVELFEATWGEEKNFHILKKFFKIYVGDFRGANLLRTSLMESKSYREAKEIIRACLIKIDTRGGFGNRVL
ncbi:MAG: tRNA-dihydrouridine synthase [bacterium]|nr:tRNA-dihydrouridine synthase [bacterium]